MNLSERLMLYLWERRGRRAARAAKAEGSGFPKWPGHVDARYRIAWLRGVKREYPLRLVRDR